MTPPRLSKALLATLRNIDLPAYDRHQVAAGILHFGVGGFHRGHQAVFTDDVLNAGGGNWGIIGASLRSPTAAAQLLPQDGLYTVNTLSPAQVQRRVIGAIRDVITVADNSAFDRLMHTFADPGIHVVTLTVTEKGYCCHNGALDLQHPEVQADLQAGRRKLSLPGVLCAGLDARRRAGGAPLTLVSCDNLSCNGRVLQQVVSQFADLAHPDLTAWLDASTAFPNTMVDRIVPAATARDRQAFSTAAGYVDEGMVSCEPFKQWVIEDRFAGPRPPWETAGAELVADVVPHETAKLRLLNGPHSACAYLGILSGYQYVADVMQDADLKLFLTGLVNREILPTVTPPAAADLRVYADRIFDRFANPAVEYKTRQVGTDGSQKLPQRLVPVVRERLDNRLPISHLSLVFAAWLEHLRDPAPDPLAELLQRLAASHEEPLSLIHAINRETRVLEELQPVFEPFALAVATALTTIRRSGLKAALAQIPGG